MSEFSNPAAAAAQEAARYIEAILELLGDRDPIEVLESSVGWCREQSEDLTREQLEMPESPGKWSIADVLQHLADTEIVWSYRLRMVIAEDRPQLSGFDQDLWADRLHYADADRDQALTLFGTLRQANLRLIELAPTDVLDRVGVHAERGEETLRHMLRLQAGHDLVHRRQIERIADKLSS